MYVGVARQPKVTLWLVRREIVEDHVDFPLRIVRHDLVHEVEKLDASASFVVAAGDLAGGDFQGCEQRCRPVPLVVVRLADQRAAGGQLEIALGSLKRLDRRLLVNREDDGIFRWAIYRPTISAALATNSGSLL